MTETMQDKPGIMPFAGRVALVTGAGAGLGRAYALRLARLGATVVVNNRIQAGQPSSAQAVVDEIVAAGGTAIADHHSVQNVDEAQAMIDLAYDTYGRLDVLICNAGISGGSPLHETSTEAFAEVFDVNFYGNLYPIKAALKRMYDAGYGRIIGTTSSAGYFPSPGTAAYASAKTALIGLFRSISGEAMPNGVTANLISPMAWSRMAAEHLDAKYANMLDPDHVAKVVTWLASEACNITGELLVAGGGQVYRATVVQSAGQAIGDGNMVPLWGELSDISNAREAAHGMETVMKLMAAFDAEHG